MFGKKNNASTRFEPLPGKRVVSDIIKNVPGPRHETIPPKSDQIPKRASKMSIDRQKAQKLPRLLIVGAALGLCFFIGFILLRIFSSVTVRVTPKEESRSINLVLSAATKKEAADSVPLEIMTFKELLQKNGKTSGIKDISKKASGVIAIFNAFSSQSQVLVKNTRFETLQGKIYRIDKSITVPGAKIVNGKIEPSSVEATVYAEEPGEGYNGPPIDFTIPGFKGTPKYEKFFGRSKTSLSGGFVGKASIVTESDVLPLKVAAENELREILTRRSQKEKPEGFLIPKGATEIKFINEEIAPAIGEMGSEFKISLTGEFSGVLVRPSDLAAGTVGKTFSNENPAAIKIINFDQLSLKVDKIDFKKGEALIKISGNAHFVWRFDEAQLVKGLLLASSANREKAFAAQTSIQRAEIIFKPSWWRIFPSNSSKIKVEEIISK